MNTTLSQLYFYLIYLLTSVGLSPDGSTRLDTNSAQNNTNNNRTTQITNNVEECGPCPVFASFTLAFALQLRKKHGKTSVRVRKTSVRLRKTSVSVQHTYYQTTHAYTHTRTYTHTRPNLNQHINSPYPEPPESRALLHALFFAHAKERSLSSHRR
jgi:hypothetical protein